MRILVVTFIFLFSIASLRAAPSVITLKSGEQVIGGILPRSSHQSVVIRSELLGELTLPRSSVVSIKPKSPPSDQPPKKPAATASTPPGNEDRQIVEILKEIKAPKSWSGHLRLGMNLSRGDQKWTETYTRGRLVINPENSPNYFRLLGAYTYRESERRNGEKFKSTDKYDGEATYRRTFFDEWFLQNAITGRVDQIKGIDHEMMGTLGLGYKYVPTPKLEFILGAGAGMEDVETAYEDSRDGVNPIAHLFQETTWKVFKRTSFVQAFNNYWNPEDPDYFKYVLTAALRIRLTDLLGFQFSYDKSYDSDVGNGSPRDDTQWRNALVLFF